MCDGKGTHRRRRPGRPNKRGQLNQHYDGERSYLEDYPEIPSNKEMQTRFPVGRRLPREEVLSDLQVAYAFAVTTAPMMRMTFFTPLPAKNQK